MAERGLTRRSVLAGLGMTMGGLAGCGQAPATTPTRSSPIVETAFEGSELVVDLRDGHDVTRLNLIDPDGELFATTDVAVGATTARLEILRIEPGSRMKHYTPGVHTLVAVGEDEERSVELEMEPSLRVVEVEQYRAGTEASDLGRLAVTVENVGTGPTWVYDVTYQDAPNWAANDGLANDRGTLILERPNTPQDSIFEPGSDSVIVGSGYPLLFSVESEYDCSEISEFTVIVGQAIGNPIRQEIRTSSGGDSVTASATSEFVCSEVGVELLAGGSDV